MAVTTGIFTTAPAAGVNYYDLSSTAKFAVLTSNAGSDGVKHIYGKLAGTVGSIATCGIGTAGSITAQTTTTATYIFNIAGGGVSGQFAWIKGRTI